MSQKGKPKKSYMYVGLAPLLLSLILLLTKSQILKSGRVAIRSPVGGSDGCSGTLCRTVWCWALLSAAGLCCCSQAQLNY
ncbi:hypothetical protein F5883DRAFT_585256 [Diaporthe sp. PMI_573]|nr:hypothetical protein F5883DRAFT_585256 [Diaporthaceae sp. PMI_573]